MTVDTRQSPRKLSETTASAGTTSGVAALTRPRRPNLALTAVVTETLAFAILLGASGSAWWRVVRVSAALIAGIAAVLGERRRGPAPRGLTAALVGIAGVTAGTGIGVMHVVKSDITLTAIAGLVVLAGGLTLLVAGVVRLWRVTRRWWRLTALPVAFVMVEFVIIPVTVAVYGTNLPGTPLGTATPATHGFAYEEASFTTSDRARLSAWYIPSTNGAAVVLLHGSGSTRTSVLDEADVLARHGYGVLMFDARGHGRSGGTGMDFGWWGNRDIDAAVTWLAARPDVTQERICAVGMSMGGEEAIGAAAADPRIQAVVAEGAVWRGSMDAAWLPTSPQGYIERAMLGIQTAVTSLLTAAPEPTSLHTAIRTIAPRSVLLIAGKQEIRGDRYLRNAAPTTVELWELPDTPHVSALSYHPAEWEARVIGFLARVLQPSAA